MNIIELSGRALFLALQHYHSVGKLRASLSRRANKPNQSPTRSRQLLVDISTLAATDAKTGIQRVSKAILRHWLMNPPTGFEVRPVCASRWRSFRYCDPAVLGLSGGTKQLAESVPIDCGVGDIFVTLDLTAHVLPHHHLQLERWKLAGVEIYFVLYDLLPTLHPEWFTEKGVNAQRRWLRTLAIYADGVACISQAVAGDLGNWLDGMLDHQSQAIAITSFPLGADISTKLPGASGEFSALRAKLGQCPTVLMVGTIEPRKGYEASLSAFENIWRTTPDINLVIVGKAGWQVDSLIERLRGHPEAGRRLHWIENSDDALLCALYEHCSGLLMASEGEGFGLPIVEAARYGLPVLARDLPVFHEIAGNAVTYFSAARPEAFALEILAWVESIYTGTVIRSERMRIYSWEDSAQGLLAAIGIGR